MSLQIQMCSTEAAIIKWHHTNSAKQKGDAGRLGEKVWVWHTLLSVNGGKILTCPRAWDRQIFTQYNKIRLINSQEIRSRNANESIIHYLGK